VVWTFEFATRAVFFFGGGGGGGGVGWLVGCGVTWHYGMYDS